MSRNRSSELRVLQICHDYEGPFRLVCRQYNEAFPDANITTVYLRGKSSDEITSATGGDRVIYLESEEGALRGIKFSLIFQLRELFREDHFDVVIAHRYKSIYLAGIMSYFFGPFLILGVAHEHNVFKRMTRSLFVTFWRRQIHLIAVSRSVARNIEASCPSLVSQGRIHTLGNAISEESELIDRTDARNELGLREDSFIFGTVGRLVEKKNFETLLSAFAEADLDQSSCLVILGSGPLESELRALSGLLGIEDRVAFVGYVDQAARYYRGFDCFVFPAGDKEAFGVVLLEAMFSGLAILASDAPGPDDVLGDVGIRFSGREDLSRKLKEVYSLSEEQRKAMGEEGRQRYKLEFTFQHFAKHLRSLPPLASINMVVSSPPGES